jgi:hypothetical protein
MVTFRGSRRPFLSSTQWSVNAFSTSKVLYYETLRREIVTYGKETSIFYRRGDIYWSSQ